MTGDGLATPWGFKRDTSDIHSVRLVGRRTASGWFGLGFDNFSFCSTTSTPVSAYAKNKKQTFEFKQNYPNPFSESTTFKYYLPADGMVTLELYSLAGKKLTTLINEHQNSGNYSFLWTPGEIPRGIYISKITAGMNVDEKILVFTK
jgi:hypothetical protein